MNKVTLTRYQKIILMLSCFGLALTSSHKAGAEQNSFDQIGLQFTDAVNSQNRDHVRDILLSPAEIKGLQKTAKIELKKRIAKDKTGKLTKDPAAQKLYYEKLLKESCENSIKKEAGVFSRLLEMYSINQAAEALGDETADSVAHKKHVLLDIRTSKGNVDSELITVPHMVFGKHIKTLSGKANITHRIHNPSTSIAKIEATQKQIAWFLEHPELMAEAKTLLTKLGELEKIWISGRFLERVDTFKLIFGSKKESEAEQKKFNLNDWFYSKKINELDKQFATGSFGLSLLWRLFNKRVLEKTNVGMQMKFMFICYFSLCLPVILTGIGGGLLVFSTLLQPTFGGDLCDKNGKLKDWSKLRGFINDSFFAKFIKAKGVNKIEYIGKEILSKFGGGLVLGGIFSAIFLPFLYKQILWKKQSVNNIHNNLIKIRQMNDLTMRLRKLLPTELFPNLTKIDQFFQAKGDKQLTELLSNLKTRTFASKPGILAHRGRVIHTFKIYDEQKAKFASAMKIVGELDSCLAAAELVSQPKANGNGFCLAKMVNSPSAMFNCQGMWDVFIDPELAITNSLALGKTAAESNGACGVLLSGPNYGGKSVFLRGMMTTAVLAQSFGIAPAKSLTMTPMDCLDTYINITDDTTAKESLFSAEIKRTESLLKSIEDAAKENKKVFVVADELLTGTHPDYASALVRAIIERVANFDNVICIFASHFESVISNVKLDTKGLFKQLHVGAKTDAQGFFAGPTYQINEGVSPVNSAFFVAKRKFSEEHAEIVERAKEILLAERKKQQPKTAVAT